MSKIQTMITRTLRIDGKQYWFSTNSCEMYDGKWSNTLYIHFVKESFPQIVYPKMRDVEYSWTKKMFDYNECDIASLPWHKGITYYSEEYSAEREKTLVKAGCDYQHYKDEIWMEADHGESLLKTATEELAREFEELVERRNKTQIEGQQ